MSVQNSGTLAHFYPAGARVRRAGTLIFGRVLESDALRAKVLWEDDVEGGTIEEVEQHSPGVDRVPGGASREELRDLARGAGVLSRKSGPDVSEEELAKAIRDRIEELYGEAEDLRDQADKLESEAEDLEDQLDDMLGDSGEYDRRVA